MNILLSIGLKSLRPEHSLFASLLDHLFCLDHGYAEDLSQDLLGGMKLQIYQTVITYSRVIMSHNGLSPHFAIDAPEFWHVEIPLHKDLTRWIAKDIDCLARASQIFGGKSKPLDESGIFFANELHWLCTHLI
jgi:hypothetical protein